MPQVASPSVPSDLATIAERYDALVAREAIERDPAQERVVAVLDALDCRSCHAPARQSDWIYTRGYPVLSR
jgi:predicted ATPase